MRLETWDESAAITYDRALVSELTSLRFLDAPHGAFVLGPVGVGKVTSRQRSDTSPCAAATACSCCAPTAVGALPERDELVIQLEAFLDTLLASQNDTERRRLLHRYLIWHLLRRLRSRNNGQPTTRQQSQRIRRIARGTIAFLDWLDAHGLTLGSCQQADLDRWRTDESAIYRNEAGQLTASHLASGRWNGPAQLLDHQHRWDTARRLLHDDNLNTEDRFAGLLVLLYAQGATAISRMTVEHSAGGP